MPFSDQDGVVTHLSNSHGMSRIEARKSAMDASVSSDSIGEQPSSIQPSMSDARDSDREFGSEREEMLFYLRQTYDSDRRMPGPSDVAPIDGYDKFDYVNEFGSLYGAATIAGKTSVDPDEYSHTTEGGTQYSEWDLVSAIWRLYERTGKASGRMMDRSGPISLSTYQHRFGSWSNSLEQAHIEGPEPSIDDGRGSRIGHYTRAEWRNLRSEALERDDYQCQSCGMSEGEHQDTFGTGLNVHHVTDVAEFDDPDDADTLDNVESLCVECHGKEHPFAT